MNDFLKYRDYFGSVSFSNEDKMFYGKVLGITDVILFEGDNVSELECNFRAAVEDYLETCAFQKRNPDKTYKGSFNVRVSSEIHKKAVLIATKHGIKLNDLVRRAMEYAIKHEHILER
jgi:predicted HicB family RNase H-like nuclease